jgi:hypothetical protein
MKWWSCLWRYTNPFSLNPPQTCTAKCHSVLLHLYYLWLTVYEKAWVNLKCGSDTKTSDSLLSTDQIMWPELWYTFCRKLQVALCGWLRTANLLRKSASQASRMCHSSFSVSGFSCTQFSSPLYSSYAQYLIIVTSLYDASQQYELHVTFFVADSCYKWVTIHCVVLKGVEIWMRNCISIYFPWLHSVWLWWI